MLPIAPPIVPDVLWENVELTALTVTDPLRTAMAPPAKADELLVKVVELALTTVAMLQPIAPPASAVDALPTHMLKALSEAIDHRFDVTATLSTDQRGVGFPRI